MPASGCLLIPLEEGTPRHRYPGGYIRLWSITSLASRSSQSLKEAYAVLLKLASVVGDPPVCSVPQGLVWQVMPWVDSDP